jgi:hypothetical protein
MTKVADYYINKRYFKKDKDAELTVRIAKYKVKAGDTVRFHEVDDQNQSTGRFYDKEIKQFHHVHKAIKYWTWRDLTKFGLYIFRLNKSSKIGVNKIIRNPTR